MSGPNKPPAKGRQAQPVPLRVDPEKYPAVAKNPALERALRIQQALAAGKPRDEAVRLAVAAMGRRAPHMSPPKSAVRRDPAPGPGKSVRGGAVKRQSAKAARR